MSLLFSYSPIGAEGNDCVLLAPVRGVITGYMVSALDACIKPRNSSSVILTGKMDGAKNTTGFLVLHKIVFCY